ncbi:hypothetical protein GFS24_08525 [Chitinophaga sp. SYP-B3965]|uniref:hypothetical protein n=1 Tax=Chitinophaga sp. SYP-B3965 TaxID=2663120 RepID=UPI001299F618|nr:hypothetical protein [Chitinophaga sp. SYP-B3965]MRG45157.1 hypothetical protein [Chitinophaga sp. SYP-B3965]
MKKIILSIAILAAVGTSSCRKDKQVTNDFNDLGTMTAFFEAYAPKAESFTLDAAVGGTITTTKGTKITFPANVFLDANNNVVSGNIKVHVKDILKASDMILGDKPTMDAKGGFLRSFGELIVKADKNGAELGIKKDSAQVVVPLGVREANGVGNKIPIWDGDTTVTYSSTGYNHVNAATAVTTSMKIPKGVNWIDMGTTATSNPAGTQSTFLLDALGQWRNCDALSSPSGTRITVLGYFTVNYNPATSDNYSGKEPTMLFFKQKNVNTLIKLYNVIVHAPAGKEGLLSYQQSFTVGMEGTFLAISSKNGKFYADMKDVTIPAPNGSDNYVGIDFAPQEVSEAGLIGLINQMNSK